MASKKEQGNIKTKVVITLLLVIGIPLAILSVRQQTNWLNHAAEPTPTPQALINLNSTTDSLATVNPDGTMGPRTWYGNWSNTLPAFLKGKLVFAVIDPPQGSNQALGVHGNHPTESFHAQPSTIAPSQAQESTHSGQKNGPQEITALNVTITKVEVHLAYLGTPGEKTSSPSGRPERISGTPKPTGQPVDHWETLNIVAPETVDLMQLAATHDVSQLGLTSLAAGRYTEVRLYVSSATATLTDGSIVTLEIPGKNNIVRVVSPFVVVAGETANLTMDVDAKHSVVKHGNGVYSLKPVVSRLIQEKPSPTPTTHL